jgi:cytochrome c oxidase subunit 4
MNDIASVTRRTYVFVYLALMLLLAATVGATFLPLGPFHTVITVAIAIAKAVLVMMFFMHLRHTRARLIFLIGGGILLLLILMGLTNIDYLTRVNGLPMVH